MVKTYTNLYEKIYSLKNLIAAWKKARKGKIKKPYVKKFEEDLAYNLKILHDELKNKTYIPKSLVTFILRDPKTRTISKSAFRDRIVHHALVIVIEPLFDETFIFDSCANRKGKGSLFAIQRFNIFKRKVTSNLKKEAFCFKADIKHYFQKIDHEVLLGILQRRIKDEKVMWLIEQIVNNMSRQTGGTPIGMPLGNLTSQFFANVYLNKFDYFLKHKLKVKYYIRYVDDFVILHKSREQLEKWKSKIGKFLQNNLKIELHPDKSRIISLSHGIDFVGFRNFYYHRLLRKRNIHSIFSIIKNYKKGEIPKEKFSEIFQGWHAYAKWANSHKLISSTINYFSNPTPNYQ